MVMLWDLFHWSAPTAQPCGDLDYLMAINQDNLGFWVIGLLGYWQCVEGMKDCATEPIESMSELPGDSTQFGLGRACQFVKHSE